MESAAEYRRRAAQLRLQALGAADDDVRVCYRAFARVFELLAKRAEATRTAVIANRRFWALAAGATVVDDVIATGLVVVA